MIRTTSMPRAEIAGVVAALDRVEYALTIPCAAEVLLLARNRAVVARGAVEAGCRGGLREANAA
jgi:hypothetical protein